MADTAKPDKLKEFLVAKGEKAGLAAAVLLLLGYVAYTNFLQGPDENVSTWESHIASLEQDLRQRHEELGPKPARNYKQDALSEWSEVPPATQGNDWATSYPTVYKPTPGEVAIIASKVYALRPLTPLRLQGVELGSVTLEWSLKSLPPDTERTTYQLCLIDHYIVERRIKKEKGKEAPWETISKDVKGLETSYRDTSVAPKTVYEYRVTPVTKSDEFRAQKGSDQGDPSPILEVRTLGIFSLQVLSVGKDAKGPMAQIKIKKYEKEVGQEVSKSFLYHIDDRNQIGCDPNLDRRTPPKERFVHSVPAGKKTVPVDFNTNYLLKEIHLDQVINLEQLVCENRNDPSLCKGLQPQKTAFKTNVVVYTDDEKKDQTLYYPEPKVPAPLYCKTHEPATAQPPQPGDAQSPVDPEQKKAREKEAMDLFLGARDKFQKADTREEAKLALQQLLDSYKDTDVVKTYGDEIRSMLK